MEMQQMIHGNKSLMKEFVWNHPKYGYIALRFSGKCVKNFSGLIVLEGYLKAVTDTAI